MLKLDIKKQFTTFEGFQKNTFTLAPLEASQAITFGNSLRRILLSNTIGLSLSGVSINENSTDFDSILGVREDTLEIILNLKEINFSLPLNISSINKTIKGFLKLKGPKIVTSNLLRFPKSITRIVQPNKYICTITERRNLLIELTLNLDKGYTMGSKHKIENIYTERNNLFLINTTYCPVINVLFFANLCYNNNGILKESLNLEIETNGSITPTRCLFEAFKFFHDSIQFILIPNEIFD